MKMVVIAQEKGGVGKTAVTTQLAFYYQEQGLNVCVIDLDIQGNSSFTLNKYKSGFTASQLFETNHISFESINVNPDDPTITLISSDHKLANIEKVSLKDVSIAYYQKIKEINLCGFDIVLIDTPSMLSNSLSVALSFADYVFSPIEPDLYSIQGISQMEATIRKVRTWNKKLNYIGILLSKRDGRNTRHVENDIDLRKKYKSLIFPQSLGLRRSVSDALALCIPVWKIKNNNGARTAGREFKAVGEYIYNKMMET